ncbi:hypothetical protein SDC9_116561 [bioreactor metagenome]|uniref:Uncharacterized protein n=1 Tax=bioreactor metagenome TaxID=1076179 RepID=A0A645C2P1_9ZZZZ
MGRPNAQMWIGRDCKGSDVQGGALFLGNPSLFYFHQGFGRFNDIFNRNRRHAETLVRCIDSFRIHFRSEKQYLSVLRFVGLQALKSLLTVMEHHCGGIKRNRAVRYDPCVMPAFSLGIIHNKHMVGKMNTKP